MVEQSPARTTVRGKGLVIVFTGDGKGKTTAALGMALRAVGHGFAVKVIQFIKGGWRYGELDAARRLAPELEIDQAGLGFTFAVHGHQNATSEEHAAAARAALATAAGAAASGRYRMLILDEVLYAVHDRLVSLEDVVRLIDDRPAGLHLVLTGRSAPPEIVAAADLVTEMVLVKHPFAEGIAGQPGVEF